MNREDSQTSKLAQVTDEVINVLHPKIIQSRDHKNFRGKTGQGSLNA